MTKRRVWIIVATIVIIVFGLPTAFFVSKNHREQAALDEQLRLARQEGLPTTGDEFMATLPKVRDSENAAPIYMELEQSRRKLIRWDKKIVSRLLGNPSKQDVDKARKYLASFEPELSLIDKAVTFPHCQFKRGWNKKAVVLTPELATTKYAASLALVRGSIAAYEGNTDLAISEARKGIAVSRHLGEEPYCISILVALAVENIVLRHLVAWQMEHPEEKAYWREIKKIIDESKPLNLEAMHRFDLVEVLSVVNLSQTDEGLRELGLRDDEIASMRKFMPLLRSRTAAKTMIVASMRQYYKELGNPSKDLKDRSAKAWMGVSFGLMSFPAAFNIYSNLGNTSENDGSWLYMIRERNVAYRVLLRATEIGRIAKKIDTHDLKSPFTGQPASYTYDGTQIVIKIERAPGEDPYILKVPPKIETAIGTTQR